jgi:hypothetical protein
MLPLHTTFRNLLSVLFSAITIFTSCSDKSEKDLAITEAIDEGLANSNKILTISTSEILTSLNEKVKDMNTHERAKYWFPKAQAVESLSKDVNSYLEEIRDDLSKKTIESNAAVRTFFNQRKDSIYDRLIDYHRKVLEIDAQIYKEFRKSLTIVSPSFDAEGKNGIDLFKTFFDNASVYSSRAMLTRMQNNIKIIENKIIMFCHEQIGTTHGRCTFISAISVQSSSIVQPGERIEIFSGVGEFNMCCNPEVFVYGKPVPMDVSGVAIFKLKAPAKPGKYYVPVKINYTDQNGMKQSIQKENEYTVAKIQK